MKGKALRGAEISFGEYGLMALEPGWITARQIEAARRTMAREMKRRGKIWIRIFPDKPYTHRPAETRMGKGKGNVEYWVAVVKPGRIMFEVGGLPEEAALEALRAMLSSDVNAAFDPMNGNLYDKDNYFEKFIFYILLINR